MIRILDKNIADKIAAGEVIERPLSIVKELVENSIDAGATMIIVEIRHGGKSYIRVTDNGCGIPEGEALIAFERHATGKIGTLQDLDHLSTLGFRGEALASISAISRLTMVTKTDDADTGVKIEMQGGTVFSQEKTGANTGTTMQIEDVFYNVPARRKFMRSDASEASAIIDLVQKLAIYYSGIAFRMINNGRTVITTSGSGDPLQTIARIYPGRDFRNLLEIHGNYVNGYISGPGVTKTNRSGQIFFVNGRYVQSRVIEKGLMDGYGDRIFSGHPIAILFLEVPPESIDVNIHPNKREIKFLESKEILSDISEAVRAVISFREAIPEAGHREEEPGGADAAAETPAEQLGIREFLQNRRREENPASPIHKSDTEVLYDEVISGTSDPSAYVREGRSAFSVQNPESRNTEYRSTGSAAGKEAPVPPAEPGMQREDSILLTEKSHEEAEESGREPDDSEETGNSMEQIPLTPPSVRMFDFRDLTVKGYVFNAYIITQAAESLYVLDQHAAHERILYEKLIREYNQKKHVAQPVLTPVILNTSSDIYCGERRWIPVLQQVGYDIEDFGTNTFIIRGIPEYMTISEAETFAKDMIDAQEEDVLLHYHSPVVNKLIMRSCKAAVKANDRLSEQEIRDLLDSLSKCVNPFSCPHGRPTFVRVTKYEIERAFRRK